MESTLRFVHEDSTHLPEDIQQWWTNTRVYRPSDNATFAFIRTLSMMQGMYSVSLYWSQSDDNEDGESGDLYLNLELPAWKIREVLEKLAKLEARPF